MHVYSSIGWIPSFLHFSMQCGNVVKGKSTTGAKQDELQRKPSIQAGLILQKQFEQHASYNLNEFTGCGAVQCCCFLWSPCLLMLPISS